MHAVHAAARRMTTHGQIERRYQHVSLMKQTGKPVGDSASFNETFSGSSGERRLPSADHRGLAPPLPNIDAVIGFCENPGHTQASFHGHGHEIGVIDAVFRNSHAIQTQPLCSPARLTKRARPSRPFASYASLRAAPHPSGGQEVSQ
jgi:hypothetical protein